MQCADLKEKCSKTKENIHYIYKKFLSHSWNKFHIQRQTSVYSLCMYQSVVLPGDLQHHDVILPFIGTCRSAEDVQLGQSAGVGVAVTPTAQPTGLNASRAVPRDERLQSRTDGV